MPDIDVDATVVVAVLREMARSDKVLEYALEAASWKAIAIMQSNNGAGNPLGAPPDTPVVSIPTEDAGAKEVEDIELEEDSSQPPRV